MGFAFAGLAGLFQPLRALFGRRRGLAQRPSHAVRGLHMAPGRAHVAWPRHAGGGAGRKPLRGLRVGAAGHGPSSAGRMLISGRMADVCAELDRLAALEAAAA